MKTSIICECCGKTFERVTGEVNRSKRKGRPLYCSLQCSGKMNNRHLPKGQYNQNLRIKTNDEYSPFRRHLFSCKKSGKCVEVTLADLKNQWEKQKGICPYTGWQLKNIANTNYKFQLDKTPDRASLDRKDSTKGYTKDNIQFISMMAQFAKNDFKEELLIEFCKAVVQHQGVARRVFD